ncbi:MAG TPA: aldo/keto reductase [bacterium]|jgi:diketogulonate reductase-like aldo/keto reductase
MIRRPFGWTDVPVPVIGQGTWNMERDDRKEALAALRAGLDAGMTHIDTAEIYGNGRVEELVADAIAGRRDEVFLVSKVWPRNASYDGVLRACDRSLKKLKTDRLDLYLLHWPSQHPIEDTLRAFEQLVAGGKIAFYGVSNFDLEHLQRAVAAAGPRRLACNQVLYHLQERAIEHAVLPWCEVHEVAVVAYSPFGSGDFPSPRSAGGKVLKEIADAHGATPHQVALALLLRRPLVFAIPKASKVAHASDNAGAGDLKLEPDELERIDKAFPRGKEPQELPMI